MVGVGGIPSIPLAHESSHVSGGSDEVNSALAATAIPVHGHTKHTDRTRHIFIPVDSTTNGADTLLKYKTSWWGADLDAAAEWASAKMFMPENWLSGGTLKLVLIANTAANIVGDAIAGHAGDDDTYTGTGMSELNHTYKTTPTIDDLYIITTGVDMTGISAGDMIYLKFNLDSGDVHFLGFIFEYGADE